MKILLALAGAAILAASEPAAARSWKDAAELSFVSANGNSRASTFSGKNAFAAGLTPRTTAELDGSALGSRSDGRVTAERYEASGKLTWKATDRDYLFGQYRWARDRFAGVLHRHDLSVGAGRELLKTAKDLWTAEGGPGYLNEERIGERRKKFFSSRLYSKYVRAIKAGSEFSQDAEWIQSLADKRDSRWKTETSLLAPLSQRLSIKNAFTWRHDSRPPIGRVKDDTTVSLSILASF